MTGDLIITKASTTKKPVLPSAVVRTQSTPTSPGGGGGGLDPQRGTKREASSLQSPVAEKKGSFGVRTSRSDDHLGKGRSVAAVNIDIDDDEMASSLNTLLDTKQDDSRVLWTYNSAGTGSSSEDNTAATATSSSSGSGRRQDGDLSEPECCTSEMASAFGSEEADRVHASELDLTSPSQLRRSCCHSNPYVASRCSRTRSDSTQVCEDTVSTKLDDMNTKLGHEINTMNTKLGTELEGVNRSMDFMNKNFEGRSFSCGKNADDYFYYNMKYSKKRKRRNMKIFNERLIEEEKEEKGTTPPADSGAGVGGCCSPTGDEESDAESLHSFHYSPKAVDMPSASRLAKRLYNLEGFKKSDVSRHLSKNNEFARVVAEEYLKFFDFGQRPLDAALRMFLHRFCLIGETQERERVLVHFSKRYLDANPGAFKSQDAVHTLTCALMLLNTDLHGEVGTGPSFSFSLTELETALVLFMFIFKALHLLNFASFSSVSFAVSMISEAVLPVKNKLVGGPAVAGYAQNIGHKMTCLEFVENLAELNEGENFPKDVLKALYMSIKTAPLEWAVDDSEQDGTSSQDNQSNASEARPAGFIGHNPFLEVPNPNCATEYKKGYVMRKCCLDPGGKRTPLGKRGWKMFCATLRDLVLYLHKDEQGFRKNQLYESLHNSIRIHHSLATKATDYTKKQHVFRLQTADQAEYLFQTG
ncbi:unnamed protein product [Ixodes persulcatus]